MTLKKLVVLGVAAALFTGSALNVSAMELQDIFDAEYYAEQYPDLKAAYGSDSEALYQHFLNHGLKEGRNMSPILDVAAYRKSYPDLDTAYGDNWDAYVNHYINYGIYEDRRKGVLFNPLVYAECYADMNALYNEGQDVTALITHYKNYGRSEKRIYGTSEGYASIAEMNAANTNAETKELIFSYYMGDNYAFRYYDDQGHMIRETIVVPEDYFHTREWDRYGRLTREAMANADNEVYAETFYTYYPNSKIATLKGYDSDSRKFEKTYDQQGQLLTEIYYY